MAVEAYGWFSVTTNLCQQFDMHNMQGSLASKHIGNF